LLKREQDTLTHCASYCFRPFAMVMGSSKVPSSDQRLSFSSDGRPAKRSSTEPTVVFCSGERSTPGAVLMFVFSIGTLPATDVRNQYEGSCARRM